MVRMANMSVISVIRIRFASRRGQEVISALQNRFTFTTFRRRRKKNTGQQHGDSQKFKKHSSGPYRNPPEMARKSDGCRQIRLL